MIRRRGSGILLHITSLPSKFGIGDLGPAAYQFADFLSQTAQSFWQVLPLNPTDPISGGNSPYSSFSAFAGNKLLISPELLYREGFLEKSDLEEVTPFPPQRVNYPAVLEYKNQIFNKAFAQFKKNECDFEFDKFCEESEEWLDDYALFIALKNHYHGKVWSDWPESLRDKQEEALNSVRQRLTREIEKEKFLQYIFFKQWTELKHYCNQNGIQIIGDVPFYISYDSADVWTNPELFKLDENKKPTHVAGVPPDYFSETGQLWGNPVYRWDAMQGTGYRWWIKRIEHNLKYFDFIRVDHFRGFAAYWEVPASETTAINGRWVNSPGIDFFKTLLRRFPNLPIIAEDLGVITPDVRELIHEFEFPGMRLLMFAFNQNLPNHPYAPHNHIENCVVYTGTHDNNTARGWFEQDATEEEKQWLFKYLGREITAEEVSDELVRLAMMSVANMVILPIQDVLGLGAEARMNRPSSTEGNWEWRLSAEQLNQEVIHKLREITELYGRY